MREAARLFEQAGVSRTERSIIRGKRAITLDTSLRLGRFFRQSPTFWLNLQTEWDLHNAKQHIKQVEREVRPRAKAAS